MRRTSVGVLDEVKEKATTTSTTETNATPPTTSKTTTPTTTALTTRGPAPHFRPDEHTTGTILESGHPNWARVDQLRQQAWDQGITQTELNERDFGYCPDQVMRQIFALEAWMDRRENPQTV